MLKGEVFKNQIFENHIFALFINIFANKANGIAKNYENAMNMTYSGHNLTVNKGCCLIQGRFLTEDSSTTIDCGIDTMFCKLVIEIDLDKANTGSVFNQGYYNIVKSESNYPELTQQDIVGQNSGKYQYELARFKISDGVITDFRDMRTYIEDQLQYNLDNKKVNRSGDTITGILNMLGNAIKFGNNGNIEWKENGYGDKFRIIPDFNGAGADNKLLIQSTVGGAGEDPSDWKTIAYICADVGDIDITGHLHAHYELGINTPAVNRHLFLGDGDGFAWIDYRSNNERLNSVWFHDDHTDFEKKIVAPNYEGKVNGYQFDLGTNNTSDSWLPVLANDKIQHRTIDNIISAYNLAKKSGDQEHSANILTASQQITNLGTLFNDGPIRSTQTYNNNTVTNAPNMHITSNGWIRRSTNTSSRRYKEDIKDLKNDELNPERLYDLKVKQFKYKEKYQPNEKDARYDKALVGFIAEEVAEIYPIAVDYNENGKVENWNDRYMIPPMLALIQKQKIHQDEQDRLIKEKDKKINDLEERINALEKKVGVL